MITPHRAQRLLDGAGDDLERLRVIVNTLTDAEATPDVWKAVGSELLDRIDAVSRRPDRAARIRLVARVPVEDALEILRAIALDENDTDHQLASELMLGRLGQRPKKHRLKVTKPPINVGVPLPPEASRTSRIGRWALEKAWGSLPGRTFRYERSAEQEVAYPDGGAYGTGNPYEMPNPYAAEDDAEDDAAEPEAEAEAEAAPEPEAEAGAEAGAEPPPTVRRAAFPLIECENIWVTDEPEKVTVGLTPKVLKNVGVTGAIVPEDEEKVDDLTVTLLLDPESIKLAEGAERTFKLPVTPQERFPTATVEMTAESGLDFADERRIGLHFRRGGKSVGFAWKRIRVVNFKEDIKGAKQPQPTPDFLEVGALAGDDPPDLVLAVYHGDDKNQNAYVWDAFTGSEAIVIPDAERTSGINDPDAAEFAAQTRRTIEGSKTGEQLFTQLQGYGTNIATAIPPGVSDTLREVAKAAKGAAATVLVVTEESTVPWEMAVLNPPVESGFATSPFLGAHLAMSRWPLVTGNPRPTPESKHQVTTSAVLTAEYEDVLNWPKLEHAEKEAAYLVKKYKSTPVKPLWGDVRACLEGEPPADWIHAALHGQFDPEGDEDGLVLLGGEAPDLKPEFLTTLQVQTFSLKRRSFIFLNACQVGAANKVLGSYGGMAVALLGRGAVGVVAPQWNVDDAVASTVAESVYADVLGKKPVSVAEALRRVRATYTLENVRAGAENCNPTLIAYQLFGHPRLTLQRDKN